MRYTPRVRAVLTRVWDPHPVSVAQALALGRIYGKGINGSRGIISTGASRGRVGAVADPTVGWAGNTVPPQLFTGWNPAAQMTTGTILTTPDGLPGTSLPLGSGSPLDSAMATIMQGSTG